MFRLSHESIDPTVDPIITFARTRKHWPQKMININSECFEGKKQGIRKNILLLCSRFRSRDYPCFAHSCSLAAHCCLFGRHTQIIVMYNLMGK